MSYTPLSQQVEESIMASVMEKINAIAEKPEDEVIENSDERKLRQLVIEMRARFARFQEELGTTGECKELENEILRGDVEGSMLGQEKEIFLLLKTRVGSAFIGTEISHHIHGTAVEVEEATLLSVSGIYGVAMQTFRKWVDELMGIERPENPQVPHTYTVSSGNNKVRYRALNAAVTNGTTWE